MIELARHLEILLLNNDCVIVPGFGGFTAHHVTATTDERDNVLLPPKRTLGFNSKLQLNDSLLAQSYVEAYDISYPESVKRIENEVTELKQHLENTGIYELNDIGILTLNDYGKYEFEPCEAGILTPSLYGLSHLEISTLSLLNINSKTTEADHSQKEETSAEEQVAEANAQASHHKARRIIALWRNLAVACIALIIFLLLPAPLANNNSQLAKSGIDTDLLLRIIPTEMNDSPHTTYEAKSEKKAESQAPTGVKQSQTTSSQTKSGYTIVLSSRITKRNAAEYVKKLHDDGLKDAEVYVKNKSVKVTLGNYDSESDAYNALNQLSSKFRDAWVMKYK